MSDKKDAPLNPYQPPQANLAPTFGDIDRPIYSPEQIAGATFLGSPMAGGWLIGSNYITLGRPNLGRRAVIAGALTTLLVFAISWWMIPITWFPPFYDLAIFLLAKKLQGEGFHRHLQQGGQQHTHLRVLLLGISFLIALLILFTITVVIVVTAMAWADITT